MNNLGGKAGCNDNNKIDLLFLNPSLNWKANQEDKIKARIEKDIPNQETPHIGVAYLLAVAKKEGIKAKYIDMVSDCFTVERLIDYMAQCKPELVGFTAFTIQIKSAAAIAEKIKRSFPDIKICVGGPHVIAMPKETLKEFSSFDFVICAEGEAALPKIFNSLGSEQALSKLRGVVTRITDKILVDSITDLDALPFPAWEEFDLSKYPGTYPHRTKLELPIVSGRGCPSRCVFYCRSLGSAIHHRSVFSVIAEIEHNIEEFKCESVAFLDETFLINMVWVDELLKIFIERGLNKKIKWSCSTRVNNISPELLKRMKEAGCYYIFFGLESANDYILKMIKKNITIEQIKNAVKWAKQAGILPVGAFIIGLPADTEEYVMMVINMAEELDRYSVTFPIAVPFPGTELREMALKGEYGMKIISDNWNYYGKQDPGVLESEDLPWAKRKQLQSIAYLRNPKKELGKYLKKINEPNV